VEEVDVRFVLLLVLTHQQQHGGVTCLIQDRLTHVDGWEGEVLQLFLHHNIRMVREEEVEAERKQDNIRIGIRNVKTKH